ncbi:MAG TPA: hypothetical protein VFA26_03650 [Gemmataceae bacterium]|nr:hypothetical protein [Gemmataceae bacterium]
MKAVLAAALTFALCGLAWAADTKADPSGTWKCETDINGQKRESTLTLKTDGGKLTGTMVFADKMESKLTDVTFKGGELSFSAVRELGDRKITIKYKVKVEGDTLKGKAAAEVGGETRSFDFEGKREKKGK